LLSALPEYVAITVPNSQIDKSPVDAMVFIYICELIPAVEHYKNGSGVVNATTMSVRSLIEVYRIRFAIESMNADVASHASRKRQFFRSLIGHKRIVGLCCDGSMQR
jgi:hypothetical protein